MLAFFVIVVFFVFVSHLQVGPYSAPYGVPLEFKMVPQALKELGYRTAMVGKVGTRRREDKKDEGRRRRIIMTMMVIMKRRRTRSRGR